jgi:hypothetical protein
LLRKALADAFKEDAALIPRAMTITDGDRKVMTGRDKKGAALGGYAGRIQEEGPAGTLLFQYNGGLVHVATITE